ncbi:MAG TPA: helix-turn-helix transcriptional regulator [Candidatus Anaerostipes excrementavium]|uniref:Helix-turn-helix transcriptional regulator n=1 Tax=Candidatus Anaerostipes excrementavium TaxID=2838463 RepID=A0A9D1WX99_9FIRM|nr:helix-turn-helix transcriptional regulator [Candidatus Anaerostipes excrementavium]
MELSIPERLKDLRVEHELTLEQLAEQTHLSKSALDSYEGGESKRATNRYFHTVKEKPP